MKFRKTSKGMICLSCWLLATLLLAGCGGSEGELVAPQVSYAGAGAGTTTRTRYLSGSVEEGATVEVAVGTVDLPADQVHVAGSRWSCTVDKLHAGSNLITVTARDPRGNQNIIKFYLIYDAVSVDSYVSPISGSTEIIGGFYDPDLGLPQVKVGSGTAVQANQDPGHKDRWSFDLTGLATGNNTVTVSVTLDGTEVPQTLTINVKANAPLLSIDPVTSPTVAVAQTLALNWSFDTAPVVSVPTATVEEVTVGTVAGTWSAPLTGLGTGKNAVAVSATDNGVTVTAHTLINQQIFTAHTPHAGEYDVNPGSFAGVTVTFSEDMNLATLTAQSFTLDSGGATVPATVSYDAPSRTATLTPVAPLASATDYTVTLTTAVQNAGGEQLAHQVAWVFTTL